MWSIGSPAVLALVTVLLAGCNMVPGQEAQPAPSPVAKEGATPIRTGVRLAPDLIGIPDFTGRLLATHNQERALLGHQPLTWDDQLASEAAVYAEELSKLGKLEHAPRSQRGNAGENLWMGTAAAYKIERMVFGWAREKALFRPGRFPNVSTTGKSADVGHYTQIIWRDTREVGCALRRRERLDYLVCRYAPAGNVIGSTVP